MKKNQEHILRLAKLANEAASHISTLHARIALLEERVATLIDVLKKNGMVE